MAYSKEDAVFIASCQNLAYTPSALWAMKQADINAKLLLPINAEILAKLEDVKSRRAKYDKMSKPELEKALKDRQIKPLSAMTRTGLVDLLASNESISKFALDPDQLAVIEQITANPPTNKATFLIKAGAGAGKTTTLAHIAKIMASESRVLVLAYNVAAEEAFIKKVRFLGVKRIKSEDIYDNSKTGVAICTFDKFGYRVNQNGDEISKSSSFRIELELAFKNLQKNYTKLQFSTLIIDEAQDILPQHVQIINVLKEVINTVIVAGDPIQELYEGASWFNEELKAGDSPSLNLRYNHRSSPKIVNILNVYGRTNFPAIYVDQIPCLSESESDYVNVVSINTNNFSHIGSVCGELAGPTAQLAYLLAPITIHKFGLGDVEPAARQFISEINPAASIITAASNVKLEGGNYIISTSKLVKGTEADTVIIYGSELTYEIVINQKAVARHIYVALSRASRRLVIVLSADIGPIAAEIMGTTIEAAGGAIPKVANIGTYAKPSIDVEVSSGDYVPENGLCSLESINNPKFKQIATPATIFIDDCNDADFINIYIKALFMERLGILPIDSDTIKVVKHNKRYSHLTYNDNMYEIHTKNNDEPWISELIEKLAGIRYPAYRYALVWFSVRAGRVWTVSARLEDPEVVDLMSESVDMCFNQLMALFKGQPINAKFMLAGSHSVYPGRFSSTPQLWNNDTSDDAAAVISYEIDIIINGRPVDILFINEINDCHRKRAAIHATLTGASSSYIFNTKNGILENIEAAPINIVYMSARAMVAIRFIKNFKMRMEKFSASKTISTPIAKKASLISVDFETDASGNIIEIGAFAFAPADYKILGVYHCVCPGIAQYNAKTLVGGMRDRICADITGLMVVDALAVADAQKKTTEGFYDWMASISADPTILHWGGSEGKQYQSTLDVRNAIFRSWIGGRINETTLKTASNQLCKDYKWQEHRAYDDCLITAIVFMSLT
jgi:hypothetical protein